MKVSNTATLTTHWLRERMKHLGEITGFALPVGLYCFRRGNGEALDNSSSSLRKLRTAGAVMLTALPGLISDVQRNLILQHANSSVFQHNYLSRYIT